MMILLLLFLYALIIKLKRLLLQVKYQYIQRNWDKNFLTAIPIYDLINNSSISLSAKERKRVEEIQLMSTKVLVGKEFGINEVKREYFFINNSYFDLPNFSKNFCNKLNKYSEHEI